jgi:uncharacterized protein with PIN domain
MTAVTFTFHKNLIALLKKERGSRPSFLHHFEPRASIKDVIESLGVPHPLIGRLLVNGSEVDFNYILLDKDNVRVSPLAPPVNPLSPHLLRPIPLPWIAFVVDVNVGKLALLLRMLGFDTLYGNEIRNGKLAEIASSQKRILLTRDISLLKRKIVMHGYLLQNQNPTRQVIEVVRLYDLGSRMRPMTRCMPCNGLLVPVSKEAIMDRLEPLTRKYYHTFHICRNCGKIYWPGSHHEKIMDSIGHIRTCARETYNTTG